MDLTINFTEEERTPLSLEEELNATWSLKPLNVASGVTKHVISLGVLMLLLLKLSKSRSTLTFEPLREIIPSCAILLFILFGLSLLEPTIIEVYPSVNNSKTQYISIAKV